MGSFSAGAAIGAGFRMIGREPVAFMVWCLAMLMLGVLPQGWVFSQMFGMFGRLAQLSAQGAADPAIGDMFQLQAQMMQLQPISYASSIVSQTLVVGAIFRAMLRPEERSWFFLRLGPRELWLGLVVLVLAVMIFMGMFALMIPVMIVAGVGAAAKVEAIAFLAPLLMFVAFGVAIWLLIRLSMAPVMSFARSTFVLFESWPFTRGHALKMFGVALALVIIVWLLELLFGAAAFVAIAAQGPLDQLFKADAANPFAGFARLGFGFWAGLAVGWAVLSTFFCAIFGAAWAEIFRSLDGCAPAEPAT